MAYLTEQDYIDRFGKEELDQTMATDATIKLDAAIRDAESQVDGYLAAIPGRVFAVPLVGPVPARITELVADLARYEVHARAVTHEIKRRRDQAIRFLENLVKGMVAIPELLPDAGAPTAGGGGIDMVTQPRVFTACSLAGYVGR